MMRNKRVGFILYTYSAKKKSNHILPKQQLRNVPLVDEELNAELMYIIGKEYQRKFHSAKISLTRQTFLHLLSTFFTVRFRQYIIMCI